MKTILEEQLKKWKKVTPSNKDKLPLWFLSCKCMACKRMRNRMGIDGNSDLINEYKARPGFKFSW